MASSAFAGPAEDYIDAQLRVVNGLEYRIPELSQIADAAATGLVQGGQLYLAGKAALVAELNGRAGGLCGARTLFQGPKTGRPSKDIVVELPSKEKGVFRLVASGDTVLFANEDAAGAGWNPAARDLALCRHLVVAFGSSEHFVLGERLEATFLPVYVNVPRDSRLVKLPSGDRVIPTATPALAIAEWAFTAELIGAGRRQGKQLAVYLSIHLDEGHKRFKRTQGLVFEPDLTPEPVRPGQYAKEFLGHVRTALDALQRDEAAKLRQAAAWLREAQAAGHKVVRHLQGHLPPAEVGQPGDPASLFTHTVTSEGGAKGAEWIRKNLGQGDVYLFLGYQQNEDAMAAAANAVGARTIFLTSLPPGPEQARNPLHLYVNPHWPVSDACLDLPGYDVKACPLSGILGMTAFYAICAEALAGK